MRFSLIVIIGILMVLFFSGAQAQNQSISIKATTTVFTNVSDACLENGQCELRDVLQVIANVFKLLRTIAFYAAIIFGIFGGIRIILSQDNPNNVKAGQKIITAAFIGLVIVFAATFIINIIITLILGYPLSYDAIINGTWLR